MCTPFEIGNNVIAKVQLPLDVTLEIYFGQAQDKITKNPNRVQIYTNTKLKLPIQQTENTRAKANFNIIPNSTTVIKHTDYHDKILGCLLDIFTCSTTTTLVTNKRRNSLPTPNNSTLTPYYEQTGKLSCFYNPEYYQ